LLGGISLAPLGVLFYGGLLLAIIQNGPTRHVCWAVVAAAGVHVVLLALLVLAGTTCPPCVVTACGAGLMLLSVYLVDGSLFRRGVVLVAAFALPLVITIKAMDTEALEGKTSTELRDRALFAAWALAQLDPPLHGKPVRIVVYRRRGCPSCRKFEAAVVPVIRGQFGRTTDIQYRPAWEQLPTPAVTVAGASGAELFLDPSVAQLREAVARALGDARDGAIRATRARVRGG